jgi:hypothetical protein
MMNAEYLLPGFSLIMPDAVSNPDNDTCVLQVQNATATCIYGGRLDYTTDTNDNISRVALYKLNITGGSLWTENAEIFSLSSPDKVLPAKTYIKVPQCMPSVCTITGFGFTYGVFKKYGTTLEQIITLNFHYNYSTAVDCRRRSPGAILPYHHAACWVQGVGRSPIIQPLVSPLEQNKLADRKTIRSYVKLW